MWAPGCIDLKLDPRGRKKLRNKDRLMTELKIGSYFLGKTWANGTDYVWGKLLAHLDNGLWTAGFFEWKTDADESNPFCANITQKQMTGWAYFSTAADLNAAVAELARSLATVAQYDRPKPAGKKKMKKAATKSKPKTLDAGSFDAQR
jgi:hypothetical protein